MRTVCVLIAAIALLAGGSVSAQTDEGGIVPHNYYNSDSYSAQLLEDVVKYHLPLARKQMRKGGSKLYYALQNVKFVLAYFPNHPKALQLATEITIRMNQPRRADRFFIKAVELYPNQAQSWLLYGLHLHRTGRVAEAVKKYRHALELDSSLVNARYNLGLALLKLGKLEKARAQAKRAYAVGYPLPGLRNALKSRGAW